MPLHDDRTRATAAAIAVLLTIAVSAVQTAQEATLEVALAGRALQPGEVVRVEVTCTCGEAAVRATAFDREVPLTALPGGRRWQGLVGIDVDIAAGTYPLAVEVSGGQPAVGRTTLLEVLPKRFATRTLRVAPEYVDPPPDLLERILQEAAMLDKTFAATTTRLWDRPFGRPVTARATGNFGSRSVFNGEPRNPHAGVDFGSPAGTVVTAPASGTVTYAGDLFFTGNTVIVDHGAGLFSLFAHLSSMTVGAGDVVASGARLGRVGATGRVTGPHLHWSVRLNGARVDPLSLLVATSGEPAPLPATAGR